MVPQLELPQGGEWIVILVIVILLFGAKKLPELSRNAARALNEFNKARSEDSEDDEKPAQVTAPQPPPRSDGPPAESVGRVDVEGGGSEGVGEERRGL
ncbi:twin-arginine translocase TatA/TatE family subunit [Kribbella sp. CWNU-51]